MDEDTQTGGAELTLPAQARLPINHCNLPPVILGSLSFQRHPAPLYIDGTQALHGEFFAQLDPIDSVTTRAQAFMAYMRATFSLDQPEMAGLDPGTQGPRRDRADYLRMLRGWMFDPDGQEAAVLKSWVESRFGLLPRSHKGPLGDFSGRNYQIYLAARARGLYNTNNLEGQLDLLYSFCQYELVRRHPARTHFRLYRGVSRLEEHEIMHWPTKDRWIMVLNNLNAFTRDPERADEFGDIVIRTQVPLPKLLWFPDLLPGALKGEQEHLVIGGVYEVERCQLL